jgi:hypothetical protein
MTLPTIFDCCEPRREVLAGELPDAIFAADLWDVIRGRAHKDYQDPLQFVEGTHPTENLKRLVKDVAERLAGVQGVTPFYKLETGFGGGKTHGLIACVHVARHGHELADQLSGYEIRRYPDPGSVHIAAFVGESSSPLDGVELTVEGQTIRTFTPWGQLALMAGGLAGYERIRGSDEAGVAPERGDLEHAFGDGPLLILLDELVLYMVRCFAMPADHARGKINSQWTVFLQTLSSIAAQRPQTAVLLTLPTEKDANARFTGDLKQHVAEALETIHEAEDAAIRKASSLTPTQSTERGAVLARRLFARVDQSKARQVAEAYVRYYEAQRDAGAAIDNRALESGYLDQLRLGYPFHPELIRLFAERLADIPEFQATRGALRLVSRTIRAVWARKGDLRDAYLLQPHHVDLTRSDVRDEILARLGRSAFERGLEADVVKSGGDSHAQLVEKGWPWQAASESSLVAFLHSLPDGSRGITPPEAALAVGRPEVDLAYVDRGLEETERRAWYMRHEGDHYLFRTRASINKRFQERYGQVKPEVRETLDQWVQEVYSGFSAFQVIPYPLDHTAIADTADRVRLAVIHYDTECGAVGAGDRLNFTKKLFTKTGVNESPRRYRNNLIFLLAESTRVDGLKDAVQALIAWERVHTDIETEQSTLAQSSGADFRALKDQARRGATGVPAEFMALEDDLANVKERLGVQELNVRSKLLDAYRILAFPKGGEKDDDDLFGAAGLGPLLECYRVDFGERPDESRKGKKGMRHAVAEQPILQCLRDNNKLVPEPTHDSPVVLAPEMVRRPPLWNEGERRLATEEVWDRLRREPELPMLLRETDLLPTLRAGLTTVPDAKWVYYIQPEKKVFTRDNATGLSPVIAENHYLYDPAAAVADRIVPVVSLSPQEIWDYLWPRSGAEPAPTVASTALLSAVMESDHFPVAPAREVLWRGLQDGGRENRWVLYLRGPNLAIGAAEMGEWPGTPRFDETTELWTYQAALDARIYPRETVEPPRGTPLTAAALYDACWPSGQDTLGTEELERYARNLWPDLTRPRLEVVLLEGLQGGQWAVWKRGTDEAFYTAEDSLSAVRVGADWVLVAPQSKTAGDLDGLRPGRGPQPVSHTGTPREVLVKIWEDLGGYKEVAFTELTVAATDRDTLDNTLLATWADRPTAAQVHASIRAAGQREVDGKAETVQLTFEGRFEELRGMLSPVWPFDRQGDLDVTIAVRLSFEPPISMGDAALEAYRTALMNANQGTVEVRVVPARTRKGGGA